MSLHIKHRPNNMEEVVGNESTKASIQTIIDRPPEKRPRSYLFQGPKGCGKTTLARILGQAFGCELGNIEEYNTANTRGIDTIRNIDSNCRFLPLAGGSRVYLIDECHKLTNDAQNALLKVLEDTPKHVYFMLCTTDPQKLIAPVIDRCTTFSVRALTRSQLITLMENILKKEGFDIPIKVLREVSRAAAGSPRKSLVILDTIMYLDNEEDMLDAILDASVDEASLADLCQLFLADRTEKWPQAQAILRNLKGEPEQIRMGVLNYMDAVLMGKRSSDKVAEIMSLFMESVFYTGKAGIDYAAYLACKL